jgi:plasmid stabilization system protein ParE
VVVRITATASLRLDDIRRKTRGHWGAEQVDRYITDLFAAFDKTEVHGVASRPIPAEFAINAFYFRHEHHFVYSRRHRHRDASYTNGCTRWIGSGTTCPTDLCPR